MAESTDASNIEQLVICTHWVDKQTIVCKEYIDADTNVICTKDVLLHMNLRIQDACG